MTFFYRVMSLQRRSDCNDICSVLTVLSECIIISIDIFSVWAENLSAKRHLKLSKAFKSEGRAYG